MTNIEELEAQLKAAKERAKQDKARETTAARREFLSTRIAKDTEELAKLEARAGITHEAEAE